MQGKKNGQARQDIYRRRRQGRDIAWQRSADLATPGAEPADGSLRIQPEQVARLEQEIDELNERLAPLTSFILPGGSAASCWLHLARTVARRAERTVTGLARDDEINPHLVVYLNRLSDLMFVMARIANNDGTSDVLWQPGMNVPKNTG